MLSKVEKNFLENIKNILSDLEDTEDGAIISLNQEEIDSLKSIPKLIEKQQKEIEEMKQKEAKRQWVRIKENGEVEPLFYISKDKIREIIKDLKSIEPSDDDYNFELQNDIHSKIDILQELLEEN